MGRLSEKEIYEKRRENCALEAIHKWWKSLTDMRQYEIMIAWYPTEVTEDTDIDKMFGDMPYENQLEIYGKEKRQF